MTADARTPAAPDAPYTSSAPDIPDTMHSTPAATHTTQEDGMEQDQQHTRQDGTPASAVGGFTSADVSDVARMSYEQARSELVETVGRLEAGGTGLEESLALWERGEALADRCQAWLDGARTRLEQVRAQAKPEA